MSLTGGISLPKSSLDWLGVVSLWIGALILAFRSWSAPLPNGAPPFLASNFWNVAPAILLTVALLVFIYRQFNPPTSDRQTDSPITSLAATTPQNDPPRQNVTSRPPISTGERIYVSQSPRELMIMVADKTHHEGQRIISPFIGKWGRVEGVFDDLSVYPNFSALTMKAEQSANIAGVSIPATSVVMFYFNKNREHLEILRRGAPIIVDGRIKEVSQRSVQFDDCELVQSVD